MEMKRLIVLRAKFKKLWKYYIIQSLLAATSLFILSLLFGKDKMVIISAMGATSFIIFALPKTVSARMRNVIGGHITGLICGAIFFVDYLPLHLRYSAAVGLAIFIMVALDLEHPPAAGTALAVVVHQVSFDAILIIILSSVILSMIHYYLKGFLKDLI